MEKASTALDTGGVGPYVPLAFPRHAPGKGFIVFEAREGLSLPASPNDPGRDDLDQRLKAARSRNRLDLAAPAGKLDDSMGIGARSGIEFVAAIVVSAGLGLLIDRWLHSSPVALLILLALGFAAGLLNVYRAMNGMGYAATYKKPVAAQDDVTDETEGPKAKD